MLAEKTESPPKTDAAHRATFFRDSGWLMIANITAGLLMWGVHFLAKRIGPEEYGVFMVFLSVSMCIPTLPLQMVLAQQTAHAKATNREHEVAATIRFVWLLTFLLWGVVAICVLVFHRSILERWHIAHPAGLWVTLAVVLMALWLPIFWGALQGLQNFLWLGWSMITNGIGRIAIAVVAVLLLRGTAAGMMAGVLIGMLVAGFIALWQTRSLWTAASAPFDWRGLLRQVVPLMLGFAAFQFLFTADTMFAKSYFDEATVGFYGSAGTMSRALMWLVGPLASVMFPRIVHSTAKSQKTDLVGLVLGGTAFLAVTGAISLSIVGPWIIRWVYGPDWVQAASSVLPWYAFAMVPLALANVLLNNLLARSSFRVVPALCVLAGVYAFALSRFHDTPVTLLKAVGVCNLLFLLICAWYTWGRSLPNPRSTVHSPLPEG
jgi:O-antigen/teichoic acid export membrane protein